MKRGHETRTANSSERKTRRRRGKGQSMWIGPTYETWRHPLGWVDSRPLHVVAVAARDADSKVSIGEFRNDTELSKESRNTWPTLG
jgi:hypothetical protein